MMKGKSIRFHGVACKPGLLYGSECWTLGKADKRQTEVAQIRFLHALV